MTASISNPSVEPKSYSEQDMVNSTSVNDKNFENYPTPEWQRFGSHNWIASDLNDNLFQATIDVGNDIELCVEAGGNPEHPPLVMIMGLGSQMIFWPDSFIEGLIDAGFFIIRFDNRDLGLSSKVQLEGMPRVSPLKLMFKLQAGLTNDKVTVPYKLTDMADDTAGLIKALNLNPAHLLGASMGGMIAQIVAAQYPDLVARVALLFTTNNRAFLQPPKPRQLYTLINRPASYSEQDIIKHGIWFINTIGTPGHIDEDKVKEVAKLRYQRCFHPQGTIQQLNAILATGSITSYSKKIQAPTLVMHGSADGLIPPSQGRVVAKMIPKATFELIDGMGHDLPAYYQPYMIKLLRNHLLNASNG